MQDNTINQFEQPMKTPKNPTGKEKIFDAKKIFSTVALVILGVIIIATAIVVALKLLEKPSEAPTDDNISTVTPEPEPEPTVPEKIDLQLALNQWVTTQPHAANSGVLIYDIDNDEIVARHNEDTKFRIESIYKMFVAYEGYYRVDHGQWDGNTRALNWNDFKGSPYTISLCLDYMIRYSYSSCAENIWQRIGQANLQTIYNEKGYKNTSIAGITSTPADLTKLYQQYWNHSDLSEESWKKIKDSMLNQVPATKDTTYARNWRQGLPSGFSTAIVYDKVGWYGDGNGNWYYYDDAAFLVFPEVEKNKDGEKKLERHYIMIVLTKNTSPKELVKLGRKIEEAVKTADNY